MKSKTSALLMTVCVFLLAIGTAQAVETFPELAVKPPVQRYPNLEQQIVETVNGINNAFMRGDMKELNSYMHPEVTMLHGHERLNNLVEVEADWKNLFAVRVKAAMAYTLKINDLKSQIYDNTIIVTFSYEHPRLSGTRVSTETGKAVYVLLRLPEAPAARSPALAQKRQIVMAHCAVIADRQQVETGSPLP